MAAALPARIEAVLDDIDVEGLTTERSTEVGRLLSAVAWYRNLDASPGALLWRPMVVEMPGCSGPDAVGVHRVAAQGALARSHSQPPRVTRLR